MFTSKCVRVSRLDGGLAELCFDREGEAINKLDDRAVDEFRQAVEAIAVDASIRGVLLTSAKDVFIVGADITEFGRNFSQTAEEVARAVLFLAFEATFTTGAKLAVDGGLGQKISAAT